MTASIRREQARDRGKGDVIIFFSDPEGAPTARRTRLSDFVAVGAPRLFAAGSSRAVDESPICGHLPREMLARAVGPVFILSFSN